MTIQTIRWLKLIAVVAMAVLCTSLFAQPVTVELNPVKDNTLVESASGAFSNGAGMHLFVGNTNQNSDRRRRAVIAFDIAGNIPAGATIQSVSLKMNMSRSRLSTVRTISLHRLTADWGEGTSDAGGGEGGGAPATSGDATWIHTFFNSAFWATPGGDFAPAPSASVGVGVTGSYTWQSTTNLVADVQGWVDNPASNFGWILIGDEETAATTKRFDSRQNAITANRPLLTLTYEMPVGIEADPVQLPADFILAQNFPNPFNPATQIRFTLNRGGQVHLAVFDMTGRQVAMLVNGKLPAGTHAILFDAGDLVSGIYFYRLSVDGRQQTKKMILMQ